MTDRKQTAPGGWQSPAGPVDPDDIPTSPGSIAPTTAALAVLFGDLTLAERDRFVRMAQAWRGATLDQQVLLEALARELHEKATIAK